MDDRAIQIERAQNLWTSFVRKQGPIARATEVLANPDLAFEEIGGLAAAKEELLTYACAATSPEFYTKWGTFPPSGILLIGERGSGKTLLGRALATGTETSFVRVDVPRMVLDVVHSGGKVGEFIEGWTGVLDEMPRLTIFFDELEFSQAEEIGALRRDLPVGPIMDFLLELVDRSVASRRHQVVGATSHPDGLRRAFLTPGRFERVVEAMPVFPDDVIAALQIHASAAEKRAGRPLFGEIEWVQVVQQVQGTSTGDWVRLLHAALRSKARAEAAGEVVSPVTTVDLRGEVTRLSGTRRRTHPSDGGNYV